MFTLRTLVILCIYAGVMYFGRQLERRTAAAPAPLPGLILPVFAWIVAMGLSVNNFRIAFSVQFSIYAFIASVALFFFFAVPAMYFSLLYVEGRNNVKIRKAARDKRTRHVRTQQRVHNDLHRRYEEEKREPLVYMPASRPSQNAGDSREGARRSTPHRTTNQRGGATAQRPKRNSGQPSMRNKRNR